MCARPHAAPMIRCVPVRVRVKNAGAYVCAGEHVCGCVCVRAVAISLSVNGEGLLSLLLMRGLLARWCARARLDCLPTCAQDIPTLDVVNFSAQGRLSLMRYGQTDRTARPHADAHELTGR